MNFEKTQKSNGFTIIELMICIGIVGVLATLSVSTWDYIQKKGLRSDAKQILYQMSLDQQQYRTKNASFNNMYTINSTLGGKFNLTILTSNQTEFSAEIDLKSNFATIDADCEKYKIELKNGKLKLSSSPKLDCL